MRRSMNLKSFCVYACFVGVTVFAQSSKDSYTVNWYADGAISALMNVVIESSLDATSIKFDDQNYNVAGQEEAISTTDGSFALFTANPGISLYLFRKRGSTVIKALECHGPYQPEIGQGWVMCFSGRTETKNRIYPTSATIYLLGTDQTFRRVESVQYRSRYTSLTRLIGNR
jgi:hypothetical protein